MDFLKLVNERHSSRSFSDKKIKLEKIQNILECSNQAPSAGNLQGYEIFVVTKVGMRTQLISAAFGQEFLGQAPIVLVFCANPSLSAERYKKRGEELYCIQDATIACTYAMLAATNIGLSSVWVGAFDEEKVMKIVGLPENLRPIALLPIGYSEIAAVSTTRRSLDELVHYPVE